VTGGSGGQNEKKKKGKSGNHEGHRGENQGKPLSRSRSYWQNQKNTSQERVMGWWVKGKAGGMDRNCPGVRGEDSCCQAKFQRNLVTGKKKKAEGWRPTAVGKRTLWKKKPKRQGGRQWG